MSLATPSLRRLAACGVAILLLLTVAMPAVADLIFFKDGFVFQGQVRRDRKMDFDTNTRESFTIPVGFFYIADGPRRLFFSPTQVRIVEKVPQPVELKLNVGHVEFIIGSQAMLPIVDVTETPFDRNWRRTVKVRSWSKDTGERNVNVKQLVAEVTPSYFRVDATERFRWNAFYLTKEISPEALHQLIDTNVALKDSTPVGKDKKPAEEPDIVARRLKKIDFYAQGSYLDLATQEIDKLEKDYPKQKDRADSARRALVKLRARDRLEELKRWQRGGRHVESRKGLEELLTRVDVPEHILSEARELLGRDNRAAELTKEASRSLSDLIARTTDPAHKPLVAAVTELLGELHQDRIDRLDAFLGQVRQEARQRKAGKEPAKSPAELLALGVTGWLLGSASSESGPDTAMRLWKTRQMILAHQREEDSDVRTKILTDFQKAMTPSVDVDEVAQFIPTLPPVTPANQISTDPVEKKLRAVRYHLQLPPEYSHHRAYPVVVVLHDGGEQATAMLERWKAAGAENGFIVVAPEWGNTCQYSDAEHRAVLQALRDVKRCYQVDSDRVFLFGLGEGGKLAYDIGFSNPSMFAGVMPMGAAPYYYPNRCWRNAQHLPLYVVNGALSGDSQTTLKNMFNNWIVRGYPTLWLTYVGRGQEWFAGEVPHLCDWMSRQSRTLPMKQLGSDGLSGPFGNEFMTLRDGDPRHGNENRFYWLSIDRASPRNTIQPNELRWNTVSPASITGRIDDTKVTVTMSGVQEASFWVVRTARGRYNIDLDRPVTLVSGFTNIMNSKRIAPNLGDLLEDLYHRADRQHLVMARIKFKPDRVVSSK
jgi:Esterase PHB depolymerase